jgi:hypothetical protein
VLKPPVSPQAIRLPGQVAGRSHDIADKILVEAGLTTSRTNGVEAEV